MCLSAPTNRTIRTAARTLTGTRGCAAFRRCIMARRYEQHGMTKTPEWGAWARMIGRCENPSTPEYHCYGGRGIQVCREWKDSFLAFYRHVGPRPSPKHSIDRIDNNGDYRPGNVRWATRHQQQANMRKSVLITHGGETLCAREWSRRTGLCHHTITARLRAGYPIDRVLSPEPLPHRSPRNEYKGLCQSEWAKALGLSTTAMSRRIRKFGWDKAIALGPANPKKQRNRK